MFHLLPNLCRIDRIIRFTLGSLCVYYGFVEGTAFANRIVALLIGAFGVLNLFASMTSHCPVYALCGVSSFKKDASDYKS